MHDTTEIRQRLTRNHKEALASLEYAHDCSLDLRRQIATLPLAEQQTEAIQILLRAVDHSDVVYEQTRGLLDRQRPQ